MPRKDLSKQVQNDKIAKKKLETKYDLEEGRSANKEKDNRIGFDSTDGRNQNSRNVAATGPVDALFRGQHPSVWEGPTKGGKQG